MDKERELKKTKKHKHFDAPFPNCVDKCKLVEKFGVCECESFCPHKFDKDGQPIPIEKEI